MTIYMNEFLKLGTKNIIYLDDQHIELRFNLFYKSCIFQAPIYLKISAYTNVSLKLKKSSSYFTLRFDQLCSSIFQAPIVYNNSSCLTTSSIE